jgi:hypothetical protein
MVAISIDQQPKVSAISIQYVDMIHAMHKSQKNNQIQQSAMHEQKEATKFDIECIHWIYIQYRCISHLDTSSIKVYI